MSVYEDYIFKSRYARYLPELQRRETWEETIDRYLAFFHPQIEKTGVVGLEKRLRTSLLNKEVMPSMRALMTAGPALERDNVAGFNCSYLSIDHQRSFDELMYILMCGTGVGFSVERQYINMLPEVAEDFHETSTVIDIADSKLGWASGFRELVSLLYSGRVPRWDVSRVRRAGATLKTFGGRASGPAPLEDLFTFTTQVFRGAAGRKLNSLECHDLCCKIADIVVVGGVRRSALISLSNLTDDRIRRAKHGEWYHTNPHRALANNSACYTEKPDFGAFLNEWQELYESKAGERGIFSRVAARAQSQLNGRREDCADFGTNPCSEIILRPNQFCNLSEVVARETDTLATLKAKVELATILGTLQATLTNFRYLRKKWQTNTEQEALLGVSITGIYDSPFLLGCKDKDLTVLREHAVDTNKLFADRLGIAQSAAITCVKPSGTVSQLVNAASGIHPRYSECYIRRVRADINDPLSTLLRAAGVPNEPDVTNSSALVFSFPIADGAGGSGRYASNVTAMEQLEIWQKFQSHWCEHKPSMTCYYRDHEFLEVGQWVYNNFDAISGISFLPYSDHVYQQAPYEPIDKKTYNKLKKAMPTSIDWDVLETEDTTTGSQELACSGGQCDV